MTDSSANIPVAAVWSSRFGWQYKTETGSLLCWWDAMSMLQKTGLAYQHACDHLSALAEAAKKQARS